MQMKHHQHLSRSDERSEDPACNARKLLILGKAESGVGAGPHGVMMRILRVMR
jgi:hypothetical protein